MMSTVMSFQDAQVKKFLATIPQYPFQAGSTLNASGINYRSLKELESAASAEAFAGDREYYATP